MKTKNEAKPVQPLKLNKEEIRKIVEKFGGPQKMIGLLPGITYASTVHNWIAREHIPDQVQVMLQLMRPDIFKKIKRKG